MKRAIEYMVANPVAANMMLIALIVTGIIAGRTIPQEVFPDVESDTIMIAVVYPGASPSEVSSALCIPIESAVRSVDNIETTSCKALENIASFIVTVKEGADADEVMKDIESNVNAVKSFPEDAERPTYQKYARHPQIMELALISDGPEIAFYQLARQLRDEIGKVTGVAGAELSSDRKEEIAIEVSPETLDNHQMTLQDLASQIKSATINLGAGAVKSTGGRILLGVKERLTSNAAYKTLAISTQSSGSQVLLGDIAIITRRLEEGASFTFIDGQRAVILDIKQNTQFTPLEVSRNIKAFIERKKSALPTGTQFQVFRDRSVIFQDRFDLLIKNAVFGLALVWLCLTLLLDIRLAFWVMLGIPASFMGSLILLPFFHVSINMMSLFGFILVLGIVVDDAIVIGENIFKHRERGKSFGQAALDGTLEVSGAVIFSVLTTMIAFLPIAFAKGMMGSFLFALPVIVICVLGISLLDALFILPAHLAHSKKEPPAFFIFGYFEAFRKKIDKIMMKLTYDTFGAFLKKAMGQRYTTVAIGLAFLILTLGLVAAKVIRMQFFPNIEGDSINLTGELPSGYPISKALPIIRQMEKIGIQLLEKQEQEALIDKKDSCLENIYSRIYESGMSGKLTFSVRMNLKPERQISTFKLKKIWSDRLASIPEVNRMKVQSRGMHWGSDIDISLAHFDHETLLGHVQRLQKILSQFDGVHEIELSEEPGNRIFLLKPTRVAESLGLNAVMLAKSVRNGFQGLEVSSFFDKGNEVKVKVLFPAAIRTNLNLLESVKIKTPRGASITLGEAATITEHIEPVSILLENGRPTIRVNASVQEGSANLDEIQSAIDTTIIPEFLNSDPDLSMESGGSRSERKKSMGSILSGYSLALIGIYTLLVLFFGSYSQPIIVMLAIPFGLAGGIIGHWILGHSLSAMSFFGFIGLSGVVVNDSLILIHAVNNLRSEKSFLEAVILGTCARVRPIMLTSVTTFLGLMPMLMETSRQAKFLIPMAISIGTGILFATFIILVLVPAFYCILEDIKGLGHRT